MVERICKAQAQIHLIVFVPGSDIRAPIVELRGAVGAWFAILHVRLQNRADTRDGVNDRGNQCPVVQADQRTRINGSDERAGLLAVSGALFWMMPRPEGARLFSCSP